MQAVRDIDGVIVGGRSVGDPVGQGDSCDCAGYSAQIHPEGDAVDYATSHGGGAIGQFDRRVSVRLEILAVARTVCCWCSGSLGVC